MAKDVNLFGEEIDEFKTAQESYGIWPFTTWVVDLPSSKHQTLQLMNLIGDRGSQREASLGTSHRYSSDGPTSTKGASTFSPAIAQWLLNLYAPKSGLCFDPFAGGGTRAIMAAKHGLEYLGVELRAEEVHAVCKRCLQCEVGDQVRIFQGDARDCRRIASTESADFLLTCPPYYNLEQYKGGDADLSMCATYDDFLEGLRRVIGETHRILKPGAYSCWVVGLHRHKDGGLIPLHHDVADLHAEFAFRFKEEIVLYRVNNGAGRRVGNFEKGDKRLIRTHEYALVFVR